MADNLNVTTWKSSKLKEYLQLHGRNTSGLVEKKNLINAVLEIQASSGAAGGSSREAAPIAPPASLLSPSPSPAAGPAAAAGSAAAGEGPVVDAGNALNAALTASEREQVKMLVIGEDHATDKCAALNSKAFQVFMAVNKLEYANLVLCSEGAGSNPCFMGAQTKGALLINEFEPGEFKIHSNILFFILLCEIIFQFNDGSLDPKSISPAGIPFSVYTLAVFSDPNEFKPFFESIGIYDDAVLFLKFAIQNKPDKSLDKYKKVITRLVAHLQATPSLHDPYLEEHLLGTKDNFTTHYDSLRVYLNKKRDVKFASKIVRTLLDNPERKGAVLIIGLLHLDNVISLFKTVPWLKLNKTVTAQLKAGGARKTRARRRQGRKTKRRHHPTSKR